MRNAFDLRAILLDAFLRAGTEWRIKGIVDADRKLYTLSDDTKLISKVFELVAFPVIAKALGPHVNVIETEERQTVYPDLTLILPGPEPNKLAIDMKSTYRRRGTESFTLGSYTAYMRPPFSKNIRYPYPHYREHWVVGFIYSRVPGVRADVVHIDDITSVVPPIRDVEVLIQEKWRIASDRPGSGNTANIGSIRYADGLVEGTGPFTRLGDKGRDIFEDYWRNFDRFAPRRYTTLAAYLTWRRGQTA